MGIEVSRDYCEQYHDVQPQILQREKKALEYVNAALNDHIKLIQRFKKKIEKDPPRNVEELKHKLRVKYINLNDHVNLCYS